MFDSDSDSDSKKRHLSRKAKSQFLPNVLSDVDSKDEKSNVTGGEPVAVTGGEPVAVTGEPVAVTGEPVAVTGEPVAGVKRKLKYKPVSRPRPRKSQRAASPEVNPEAEKTRLRAAVLLEKYYANRAAELALNNAVNDEEQGFVESSSTEEVDPDDEENPPASVFDSPEKKSSESE